MLLEARNEQQPYEHPASRPVSRDARVLMAVLILRLTLLRTRPSKILCHLLGYVVVGS